VDIVSKNGGMLLNVGPASNGTIPIDARRTFLEMGDWLKICGEAVYQSRPYHLFGDGPTQVSCGSFTDNGANFTSQDFRFTMSPTTSTLYVFCMGAKPGTPITIYPLGGSRLGRGSISGVHAMGHHGKVTWNADAAGLHVILPKNLPTKNLPPVLRILGMSDLQWDGVVRQGIDDHSIMLRATQSDFLSGRLHLDVSGNYVTVSNWMEKCPNCSVHWTARVDVAGTYYAYVMSASPGGKSRNALILSTNTSISIPIPSTSSSSDFKLSNSVPISLGAGTQPIVMVLQESDGENEEDPDGFQLAYVLIARP